MTTKTTTGQAAALETLRELAPAGATVYTILRHVSQSGMSREISPVVIVNGEPRDLTYALRAAGLGKVGSHDGIKVGGAGMDMGFHLVYSLSQSLYADGYALNQRWI